MNHKDKGVYKKHKFLPSDCYFVGDGFNTFSDGSDYYHWSLDDMYTILSNQIPYEVATEWADWTIENEEKPFGWVNLTLYYFLRMKEPNMLPKYFWRKIQREAYQKKADSLSDAVIKKNEEEMEKMKETFLSSI